MATDHRHMHVLYVPLREQRHTVHRRLHRDCQGNMQNMRQRLPHRAIQHRLWGSQSERDVCHLQLL